MKLSRDPILAILAAVALTACASYGSTTLDPWVGASEDELTQVWGYPQTANDIARIDDTKTTYTYRYLSNSLFSPPTPCVVSFTLENRRVRAWRYNGGNCPNNERSVAAGAGSTRATSQSAGPMSCQTDSDCRNGQSCRSRKGGGTECRAQERESSVIPSTKP